MIPEIHNKVKPRHFRRGITLPRLFVSEQIGQWTLVEIQSELRGICAALFTRDLGSFWPFVHGIGKQAHESYVASAALVHSISEDVATHISQLKHRIPSRCRFS